MSQQEQTTLKAVGLETIADGVAKEFFEHELAKIAANIFDKNTSPIGERTLTLKFAFKPDENREEVKVTVTSSTKLAPIKGHTKTVHAGRHNGKPALFGADTKQIDMFDAPEGVTQIGKAAQ